MQDCLFCKIVNGDIPSKKAYEDDKLIAFYDIEPQAPVHVLLVPKKHYDSILKVDDPELMSYMFQVAAKLAEELGIAENGFRLVINTGEDGGQSVGHLHIHMLGGRSLAWPPG